MDRSLSGSVELAQRASSMTRLRDRVDYLVVDS
jgi:hypothetical protein